MKPGTYKHVNNTDVAFKIVTSYWSTSKNGWKVKGLWMNIVNPKNVFLCFPYVVNEFITKAQAKNWKEYPWRS